MGSNSQGSLDCVEATLGYMSAPGKPETTRVKVPPVELDGSRPKEMSGMRPRGQSRKRGIL